ncbi:MAG: TetR/AcrR family transcriptional regulator [Oscillospiraceae bacterium]|nr:TetR/AcrR family transcriptional regulator [Oscillospiraceae bacterium]
MPNEAANGHKKAQRKKSIIDAALKLFSEKGYENTRVDDIAKQADVNKALIYYYFENKESILKYLLDEFYSGLEKFSGDFIANYIVKSIKGGKLVLQADGFKFESMEELLLFEDATRQMVEDTLHYFLDNRDTVRVMIAESLKNYDKSRVSLLWLMDFRSMDLDYLELMEQKENNPIYKIITAADGDDRLSSYYSNRSVMYKFFCAVLPLLSMATYFDDYRKASRLSESELRRRLFELYLSTANYCTVDRKNLTVSLY